MKGLVLAATLGAGVLLAPAALASRTSGPSCSLLSNAKLSSVLGFKITSDSSFDAVPNEMTCYYATKQNPEAVIVIYQTQDGFTAYLTAKQQAAPYAKTIKGIGAGAFYDANAGYQSEPEVNLRYGDVEVAINAYAPLPKVEALAKAIVGAL